MILPHTPMHVVLLLALATAYPAMVYPSWLIAWWFSLVLIFSALIGDGILLLTEQWLGGLTQQTSAASRQCRLTSPLGLWRSCHH